jgi:PKD repeat protein
MMEKKKEYMNPFIICMIVLGILVLGSALHVVADEPPVADADPDHQTVVAGEVAYFSGSESYDTDGYIVAYYWVFGDGICYRGENITYTFNAVGNFTVTLTVEDNYGNQDTDYVTVNVVEDDPPSEPLMVWIESLETDKVEYEVNENVFTQATVQRGNDLLTYVWEGALVLEVLDQSFIIMYSDERSVYLPYGGTQETHEFEFMLAESGDYFVRASLYDMHDELLDVKEVCITVCDDGNGTKPPNDEDRMVWIESLTTDKVEYEVNEVVNAQVIVKRGDDLLDYVWEGILILEVFDDAMVLVYTEAEEVSIPCGGWTQTFDYEFALTSPGDHLVRATLYDQHYELMDIKEICITVGDGTPPPNDEDRMVWIESLTTDKDEYIVDETIKTTVVVKRGDDLLTYVWEGTLILDVLDDTMVIVFSDESPVYLPHGGMTETHNFEYILTEPGDYLVRATLYDFHNELVDIKEITITVGDGNSGGNGTTLPNDKDETLPPNDLGFFTGDKGGIFQMESGLQTTITAIVITVIIALSTFGTIRYYKVFRNKKEKL